MNNQITAVDQNATGDQNAVVYQNAPVYQPVPVYQNVALYQNSTITDVHMQQMIDTNAAIDYAVKLPLLKIWHFAPQTQKRHMTADKLNGGNGALNKTLVMAKLSVIKSFATFFRNML
jgi:hypothetical protein